MREAAALRAFESIKNAPQNMDVRPLILSFCIRMLYLCIIIMFQKSESAVYICPLLQLSATHESTRTSTTEGLSGEGAIRHFTKKNDLLADCRDFANALPA